MNEMSTAQKAAAQGKRPGKTHTFRDGSRLYTDGSATEAGRFESPYVDYWDMTPIKPYKEPENLTELYDPFLGHSIHGHSARCLVNPKSKSR